MTGWPLAVLIFLLWGESEARGGDGGPCWTRGGRPPRRRPDADPLPAAAVLSRLAGVRIGQHGERHRVERDHGEIGSVDPVELRQDQIVWLSADRDPASRNEPAAVVTQYRATGFAAP